METFWFQETDIHLCCIQTPTFSAFMMRPIDHVTVVDQQAYIQIITEILILLLIIGPARTKLRTKNVGEIRLFFVVRLWKTETIENGFTVTNRVFFT